MELWEKEYEVLGAIPKSSVVVFYFKDFINLVGLSPAFFHTKRRQKKRKLGFQDLSYNRP